jgi:predicted kinase
VIDKRPYEPKVLHVEAFGHEFEMTRLAAADWIAMRRGDIDDGAFVGLALDAITDSSLPDGTVLDVEDGLALMRAWVAAHKEEAVPPA